MGLLDKLKKGKDKDGQAQESSQGKPVTPGKVFDRLWLKRACEYHGIEPSIAQDRVDGILNALNHTGGYCPCVPKYLHDDDHKCPCKGMLMEGYCHCGMFKDIPKAKTQSSTQAVISSTGGTNAQLRIASVTPGPTDGTLVLQYDNPSDLGQLRSIVRGHMVKSATSHINNWIEIDIFVNINSDPGVIHGRKWSRIVYECLKDNPSPGTRFPDGYIVHVSRTVGGDAKPIDTLFIGTGEAAK